MTKTLLWYYHTETIRVGADLHVAHFLFNRLVYVGHFIGYLR